MNFRLVFIITILSSAFCFSQTKTKKDWTLVECVNYALEKNISVELGKLDQKDRDLEKLQTIGNMLPSVNAQANHSWNGGLNQNLTTGILENTTRQFSSGGLSVQLDIFKGFQNLNQLYRANSRILAAKYNLEDVKMNATVEVINAYLQILFSREALKVAKAQLDANQKDLERTKKMVEKGVSAKGDLYEIEANVASTEQQVITEENNLMLARITLAQILLLDDVENFDIQEDTPFFFDASIMDISVDDIMEKIKENSYKLKLSEINIEIAKKDYKIARGALYPSLSAFYNYNTRIQYADRIVGTEINTDNPVQSIGSVEGTNQTVVAPNYRTITGTHADIGSQITDNAGHSYGVSINIPVLNGLRSSSNIKSKKIEMERRRSQYQSTVIELERLIYQTWNDVKGTYRTYIASEKTLFSVTEAYKYSEIGYKSGVRNIFEFTQAKSRLQGANADYIRAKYDFLFKLRLLEYYFGVPISEIGSNNNG